MSSQSWQPRDKIAVVAQDPRLNGFVDSGKLERMSNRRGLSYGEQYRFFGDAKEVDFLKLGCKKTVVSKGTGG